MIEEQTCSKCGEVKPLNRFRKRSNGHYRLQCKDCINAHQREYLKAHPEQYAIRRKRQTEKLKQDDTRYAHFLERRRAYERKRSQNRIFREKLAHMTYLDLLEQQGGLCAICGQPETSKDRSGGIRSLALDHNHRTGQQRGLLCFRCNIYLAVLENENFVSAAQEYLAHYA